jgi:hypothetical protein
MTKTQALGGIKFLALCPSLFFWISDFGFGFFVCIPPFPILDFRMRIAQLRFSILHFKFCTGSGHPNSTIDTEKLPRDIVRLIRC